MTDTQTPETDAKKAREAVPEIPFQSVAFDETEFVPRTAGGGSTGRKRSEYMVQLGNLLKDHFVSGKPAGLECAADEKSVAALEKKIGVAAAYEKVGIRFGGYVKSKNKGMVIVTFRVVEQTKRPRKKPASDAIEQ